MINCCDEISDPTPIHVVSRIARIIIRSKQDRSWNLIGSRNRELTRNWWSDHFFTVIGSFLESGPDYHFQSIIHYYFSSVCIVHCGVILDHIIPRCGNRLLYLNVSWTKYKPWPLHWLYSDSLPLQFDRCFCVIMLESYFRALFDNVEYSWMYYSTIWLFSSGMTPGKPPHDNKLLKKTPWHPEYRR